MEMTGLGGNAFSRRTRVLRLIDLVPTLVEFNCRNVSCEWAVLLFGRTSLLSFSSSGRMFSLCTKAAIPIGYSNFVYNSCEAGVGWSGAHIRILPHSDFNVIL
jgi:hypothetical protein